MTTARTAALVTVALIAGPLHTIALGICVCCFEQSMAMRRAIRKNGLTAAAA